MLSQFMLPVLALSTLNAPAPPAESPALGTAEITTMLKSIDERQRNFGDYKTLVFIEQKERDKSDLLYEAVIYRRDDENKLVILFQRPKTEAGKGYLRIDKNLFLYDPTVGKWERRTERERIGGTNSNRVDFDQSRLASDYTAKYGGRDSLGKFAVHHLVLTVKEKVDVAYPVVHLWVDVASTNVLKRQEFALSGRLMRTSYYPKWNRIFSESKKDYVFFPREIRIFDEVEKGNTTTIVMRKVDLRPLASNIFTKAWMESRSR